MASIRYEQSDSGVEAFSFKFRDGREVLRLEAGGRAVFDGTEVKVVDGGAVFEQFKKWVLKVEDVPEDDVDDDGLEEYDDDDSDEEEADDGEEATEESDE